MTTIKDVAEKSGVTVTTVSRVLNNRGYISAKTRQAVMAAIEELNYHPNEIARSLFRQKSNLLGLIVPTVSHPFFGEFASLVETYAYQCGYKILLGNSHLDQAKERDYFKMLTSHKVDGIILGSQTIEVEAYIRSTLPIVTIDRSISSRIPYVSSDNYAGGKLAADLLISRGCRCLAHICGSLSLNMLSNRRYDAFIVEANNHQIKYVTMHTDLYGFDTVEYKKILERLFQENPDIDGIFCSSDLLAAYAMRQCRTMGKRIPDDVQVVGYDDINFASLTEPPLTTISQPKAEMARLAVDILLSQIAGAEVAMANILPIRLIEGAQPVKQQPADWLAFAPILNQRPARFRTFASQSGSTRKNEPRPS